MIAIKELPTSPPRDADKGKCKDQLKELSKELGDLQYLLRANKKQNLLVILQGMDASGKDGIAKKVFADCSVNGVRTSSFKKPSELEFSHDFLWRVHQQVPAQGEIVIFNRSHYEDVLIQRVHGWISEERAQKRLAAINAFEELLTFDNHTVILKFFLNISKEQQAIELQERIDEPKKHWKFNQADWDEREHWDKYMWAYEEVLNHSTIPWHPIPMDVRWYGRYLVAKKLVETLKSLNLTFPPLKKDR